MPVRVLDRYGSGQADDIARGHPLRSRSRRQRDQHELQLRLPQEGPGHQRRTARCEPRRGRHHRLDRQPRLPSPASRRRRPGRDVVGVGGATEGGCIGAYSLAGKGVDVVAPGGGTPMRGLPLGADRADLPGDPERRQTRPLFGEPSDFVGTSMAAAHVSGVAAMILASGVHPAEAHGPEARRRGRRPPRRHRPRPRPAADRRGRRADRRRARHRPRGLSSTAAPARWCGTIITLQGA